MRQIAGQLLWIGNAGDLRDPRGLFEAGIEAIVEVADNEAFVPLPRELIRCRFPLSDGGENQAWLLQLAVECVATCLRAKSPTLVCCSCGLNRSVCIAAGGIAIFADRPLDDVLVEIARSGPADVSARLVIQLRAAIRQTLPA